MCVQTINTETDCLYLEFLNDCNDDRAYPPLRLYENDDFVLIDADDGKQISIAKVGFQVYINGQLYTDILEAQRQLAIEIQCVNSSRTGGAISELITIKEKVCTIVDGEAILPTGSGLQTYTPAIANEAQLIDSADIDRTEFIFQVKNGDCYLRFSDQLTNPASRVEKTVFLSDGQTLSANYSSNGSVYQGALSVINTEDGGTFDFVFLKFNK